MARSRLLKAGAAAAGGIAITVGAGGASTTVAFTGVSAAALGASVIIVATGGAAGLALLGYGAYRRLSKDKPTVRVRTAASDAPPIVIRRSATQGR